MIIKVAIPNQIQLKVVPRFKSMFLAQKGEIHYIGGSEILPPPLNPVEESEAIHNLSTEQEQQAKATLIEHNLRLVVYICLLYTSSGKDAFHHHLAWKYAGKASSGRNPLSRWLYHWKAAH